MWSAVVCGILPDFHACRMSMFSGLPHDTQHVIRNCLWFSRNWESPIQSMVIYIIYNLYIYNYIYVYTVLYHVHQLPANSQVAGSSPARLEGASGSAGASGSPWLSMKGDKPFTCLALVSWLVLSSLDASGFDCSV